MPEKFSWAARAAGVPSSSTPPGDGQPKQQRLAAPAATAGGASSPAAAPAAATDAKAGATVQGKAALSHSRGADSKKGSDIVTDDAISGQRRSKQAGARRTADGNGRKASGRDDKPRELDAWTPESLPPDQQAIIDTASRQGPYDQFVENAPLIREQSTYKHELYTTSVDPNSQHYKDHEAEAIRIDDEVKASEANKKRWGNGAHGQRGGGTGRIPNGNAASLPAAARPGNPNAYVPPAKRGDTPTAAPTAATQGASAWKTGAPKVGASAPTSASAPGAASTASSAGKSAQQQQQQQQQQKQQQQKSRSTGEPKTAASTVGAAQSPAAGQPQHQGPETPPGVQQRTRTPTSSAASTATTAAAASEPLSAPKTKLNVQAKEFRPKPRAPVALAPHQLMHAPPHLQNGGMPGMGGAGVPQHLGYPPMMQAPMDPFFAQTMMYQQNMAIAGQFAPGAPPPHDGSPYMMPLGFQQGMPPPQQQQQQGGFGQGPAVNSRGPPYNAGPQQQMMPLVQQRLPAQMQPQPQPQPQQQQQSHGAGKGNGHGNAGGPTGPGGAASGRAPHQHQQRRSHGGPGGQGQGNGQQQHQQPHGGGKRGRGGSRRPNSRGGGRGRGGRGGGRGGFHNGGGAGGQQQQHQQQQQQHQQHHGASDGQQQPEQQQA